MAGRMELVIGGSGSGKSAYAESAAAEMHRALCTETGTEIPFYYIADMIPHGAETEEKIRKHREMRKDRGFQTLEWYVNLEEKIRKEEIPEGSCALLECVSNLTANEMYESDGAREDAAGRIRSASKAEAGGQTTGQTAERMAEKSARKSAGKTAG